MEAPSLPLKTQAAHKFVGYPTLYCETCGCTRDELVQKKTENGGVIEPCLFLIGYSSYATGANIAPVASPATSRSVHKLSFDETVNEIKAFLAKYGCMPRNKDYDVESEFSAFVQRQRNLYRQGKLSETRIACMETIQSFSWTASPPSVRASFDQSISHIKEFYQRHSELPKQNGRRDQEKRLAEFLHTKKRAYKEGKLSLERIQIMESLPEFIWDRVSGSERLQSTRSSSFADILTRLRDFVASHGQLPRSTSNRQNELELASFVTSQRVLKRKGQVAPDRVAELESIPGFLWKVGNRISRPFRDSVADIVQFVTQYGELPKKNGVRLDGREARLAAFLKIQRRAKRNQMISDDRVLLLESVPGFSWVAGFRRSSATGGLFMQSISNSSSGGGAAVGGEQQQMHYGDISAAPTPPGHVVHVHNALGVGQVTDWGTVDSTHRPHHTNTAAVAVPVQQPPQPPLYRHQVSYMPMIPIVYSDGPHVIAQGHVLAQQQQQQQQQTVLIPQRGIDTGAGNGVGSVDQILAREMAAGGVMAGYNHGMRTHGLRAHPNQHHPEHLLLAHHDAVLGTTTADTSQFL